MLCLVPFQNKVVEIRAENLGRQFLTNILPPPLGKCWGRTVAPDDLSDVNTFFNSKKLQTVHRLPSYRFDLVVK